MHCNFVNKKITIIRIHFNLYTGPRKIYEIAGRLLSNQIEYAIFLDRLLMEVFELANTARSVFIRDLIDSMSLPIIFEFVCIPIQLFTHYTHKKSE